MKNSKIKKKKNLIKKFFLSSFSQFLFFLKFLFFYNCLFKSHIKTKNIFRPPAPLTLGTIAAVCVGSAPTTIHQWRREDEFVALLLLAASMHVMIVIAVLLVPLLVCWHFVVVWPLPLALAAKIAMRAPPVKLMPVKWQPSSANVGVLSGCVALAVAIDGNKWWSKHDP